MGQVDAVSTGQDAGSRGTRFAAVLERRSGLVDALLVLPAADGSTA